MGDKLVLRRKLKCERAKDGIPVLVFTGIVASLTLVASLWVTLFSAIVGILGYFLYVITGNGLILLELSSNKEIQINNVDSGVVESFWQHEQFDRSREIYSCIFGVSFADGSDVLIFTTDARSPGDGLWEELAMRAGLPFVRR